MNISLTLLIWPNFPPDRRNGSTLVECHSRQLLSALVARLSVVQGHIDTAAKSAKLPKTCLFDVFSIHTCSLFLLGSLFFSFENCVVDVVLYSILGHLFYLTMMIIMINEPNINKNVAETLYAYGIRHTYHT